MPSVYNVWYIGLGDQRRKGKVVGEHIDAAGRPVFNVLILDDGSLMMDVPRSFWDLDDGSPVAQDPLAGLLAGLAVGWFSFRLISQSVCGSVGCPLVGLSAGGWIVGRLVGWLFGWLG